MISERFGYTNLHKYVNKLCEISDGKYLWLWNDDAVMSTCHWDITFCDFISMNINQLSKWSVFDFSYNEYNFIFPCIQKVWYDVLGHYSLNRHCDTWIECVAKSLNLVQKIENIYIFHLKDRVSQEQLMDIKYDEVVYCPVTFYDPVLTQTREQDTLIIKTILDNL